jgi:putative ABC transport system permease protein
MTMLESIAQDLRFAVRAMGRTRGLVAAGVFSVMADAVSARTPEIGIRVAIGAPLGRQIALMVMGQGARLIASGYVLGAVAAYWLSRAVAGWLPGISATDPLILGTVGGVVAVVGLGACLIPALHAARVDPIVALRVE